MYSNWRAIAFLFVGVFAAWLAVTTAIQLFVRFDFDDAAKIGDSFGSVNALFSGLALAGVIVAILLQRQELQLQRDELQLTREELARAATAQERSQEALTQQADSLLLAAYLTAINTLHESNRAGGDSTFGFVGGEYDDALRSIAKNLEPKIASVAARSVGDDAKQQLQRAKSAIVDRVKDRAARLNSSVLNFDHKVNTVEDALVKLRDLKTVIEDTLAVTDDDVLRSLNVRMLHDPLFNIRKCLEYSHIERDPSRATKESAEFYSRVQRIVTDANAWARRHSRG